MTLNIVSLYRTYDNGNQGEHTMHYFKSLMGDEDAIEINKLYGIYRAQTITCQATKKKKIRNPYGYFDGVLRNLIDKTVFENAFMDYDVVVEFRIPGV